MEKKILLTSHYSYYLSSLPHPPNPPSPSVHVLAFQPFRFFSPGIFSGLVWIGIPLIVATKEPRDTSPSVLQRIQTDEEKEEERRRRQKGAASIVNSLWGAALRALWFVVPVKWRLSRLVSQAPPPPVPPHPFFSQSCTKKNKTK